MIDFKTAIDSLSQNYPVEIHGGRRGKFLQYIVKLLEDRLIKDSVNGVLIDHAKIGNGIPQESVISPILFKMVQMMYISIRYSLGIRGEGVNSPFYANDLTNIDPIKANGKLQITLHRIRIWNEK